MLVAVDTNVLIDQALGDADVITALAIIQRRLENDAQENGDFRQTLKDCDVEGEVLVIARPVTIVQEFFGSA